jgi:pyridoxamine 5'-phosphate oxidase
MSDPLQTLERWLGEARAAGEPTPAAMTLATVAADGRPSARVVSLKRLEADALVFTTGLWTRKARELSANPSVAVTFHWPLLGRQARVEGRAELAERELAEELFAERPRAHQLQALVSRQGERIGDLESLRARLEARAGEIAGEAIPCPEDWGAVRIRPAAVELWRESPDRLHERLLAERVGGGWRTSNLAP